MALVVGVNSWVTIAEADSYLELKPGTQDWFDLADTITNPGDEAKESYLAAAYYWLLDDTYGLVPSTTADDYVKRAQIEAALFLLRYSAEFEKREALIASGVEDFQNSKWEETLGRVNKPQKVDDILQAGGYSTQNALVDLSKDSCS